MGFKLKVKNPIKQLTNIFRGPMLSNAASAMDTKAFKKIAGSKLGGDIGNLGQANVDVVTGLGQGNLGKSLDGVSNTFSTFGQMTGLVQRPEDRPEAPNLDAPGIETPDPNKITEDANDDVRKRLGGRFASRLLGFGGGSGLGATRTSSSSLLGF